MDPRETSGARAVPGAGAHPSLAVVWLLGSAFAAIIVLASSRGDVYRMTYGDGLIYRYVARHLTTDRAAVDPVVTDRGASLRYGRVGLPALIWLSAAGDPDAMRVTQPVVVVVAAGGAAAAVFALLGSTSIPPAFVVFLAPGFGLAIAGGYAEVLAVALGAWAVVAASRRRWIGAALLLSAAILTRENAIVVLVGLLVWHGAIRKDARAAILGLSVLPPAAWYLFVASRYGHLPPFDPYLRETTDTVAPPFVAVARSLSQGSGASIAAAAVHLVVALAGLTLWRRSAMGAIAAAAALQIFVAGPFAWRYVGDAVRTSVFIELFVLLAIVAARLPAAAPRSPPA